MGASRPARIGDRQPSVGSVWALSTASMSRAAAARPLRQHWSRVRPGRSASALAYDPPSIMRGATADSGAGLPEIHQLPQRVVRVTLHQLLALVVVDAQLSGEPQLSAVEPGEPGDRLLGPPEVIDELVRGEVGVPGISDDVPLFAIGVRGAGHVAYRLAGRRVGVSAQLLEGDLAPSSAAPSFLSCVSRCQCDRQDA
jgi:hypothetical protein